MGWSHSSLKMYETCARQYHAIRILKQYPRQESDATLYGTEVHAAAEEYTTNGTPIPEKYGFMRPIVEALMSKQGDKFAELELALDVNLQPCAWESPKAWVRGIIDLLILDGDLAWILDYKTGNDKYPDKDQLALMSLLTFAYYPEVQRVNAALLFVVKDSMVKAKYKRSDIDKLWWDYRERVSKMESDKVWNPRQSGLCKKWCPVLSCEINGRH